MYIQPSDFPNPRVLGRERGLVAFRLEQPLQQARKGHRERLPRAPVVRKRGVNSSVISPCLSPSPSLSLHLSTYCIATVLSHIIIVKGEHKCDLSLSLFLSVHTPQVLHNGHTKTITTHEHQHSIHQVRWVQLPNINKCVK